MATNSTTKRSAWSLRCLLGVAGVLLAVLGAVRIDERMQRIEEQNSRSVGHFHLEFHLYPDLDLKLATAEVEFWPGEEDQQLTEWEDKWLTEMEQYQMTGGCGCCNRVYTVRGPRVAILEFPISAGRRMYYPNWKEEVDRAYVASRETDESKASAD